MDYIISETKSEGSRMVRETQKYLSYTQMIIDLMTVIGSFTLAFYFRFYTDIFGASRISIPLLESLVFVLLVVPLYLIVYNMFQLYNYQRQVSIFNSFIGIVKANSIVILVLILILFVFKIVDFSRYLLVSFYALNIFLTTIERIGIGIIIKRYQLKGYHHKKCLIVGMNDLSFEFIKATKTSPSWGYNILGFLDDHEKRVKEYKDIIYLGKLKSLEHILESGQIDVVIIALAAIDYMYLGDIIKITERNGVKTKIIPFYYQYIPSKPYMDDFNGVPIFDTRRVPLDNVIRSFTKRLVDIIVAIIGLIVTSPIMLFSVLMIKITSPGPVIYKQERVGLNRKHFEIYKFRSMNVQCEEKEKSEWTTKNDTRKTSYGTFMRKMSIDELPQLVNVLKGEMSIVGPRPERPQFVEQFKDEIPKYMIKHQVRPGLTGWAQVNGWRGDTSIKKRIEHDLYYIENWTLAFDFKIILLTFLKGIVNKNGY